MEAYTSFARVYDMFMDNVPYEKWSRYIVEKLRANGIDSGYVVDLGCGTGKLTTLLADAGYDMIGIDNSFDMLDMALEREDDRILYLMQDMREFEPGETAALGRLLSAGAMMGAMMKGDKDIITLQIQCSGPAKGLTVTADSHGNVKGFAINPQVELPLNAAGKLDVGGALDLGILTVIKDMGLKEPYSGQCELKTGEIAEDLTYCLLYTSPSPRD